MIGAITQLPPLCLNCFHREFALNKAHPDKHCYSKYEIKILTDLPFRFLFVICRYNGYVAWPNDPISTADRGRHLPALYTIHLSIQRSFSGRERPGREVDNTPPASSAINNAWRPTSTSPHVLMARHLITKISFVVYRHEMRGVFSDDRLVLYLPCNSATLWRQSLQVPLVTPSARAPISSNAISRHVYRYGYPIATLTTVRRSEEKLRAKHCCVTHSKPLAIPTLRVCKRGRETAQRFATTFEVLVLPSDSERL
jgi:hypothetical protein